LAFPAIQRLYLRAADLSACIHLLTAIHTQDLRLIDLRAAEASPQLMFGKLFQEIRRGCSCALLSRVTVSEETTSREVRRLTLDVIRPLFAFHGLVVLSIFANISLDLGDLGVKEMARDWPKLRVLRLGSSGGSQATPKITIKAIGYLVEYCRDLSELAIKINGTKTVPLTSSRPSGGITNNRLQLDFMNSPISHPRRVAAFLSDIIPGVTGIHTDFEDSDDELSVVCRAGWNTVAESIGDFAAVREQERLRKKKDNRNKRRSQRGQEIGIQVCAP
jgi:hypothetical protein